ncbi:MAG: C1 family peptidase [Pseudomonadota bacterium]
MKNNIQRASQNFFLALFLIIFAIIFSFWTNSYGDVFEDGIKYANYDGTEITLEEYDLILPRPKIDDQADTGRCWIFATTAAIEASLKKKGILINISESYIYYWALYHKFADSLNRIIYKEDFAEAFAIYDEGDGVYNPDDYTINFVQDGGVYQTAMGLIAEYGFVQEEEYPETATSEYSEYVTTLLGYLLMDAKQEFRKMYDSGSVNESELIDYVYKHLDKAQALLDKSMGKVPNSTIFKGKETSPKELAESLINIGEMTYIDTFNDPRYPTYYFNKLIFSGNGNSTIESPIYELNLSFDNFINSIRNALNNGVYVPLGVSMRTEFIHTKTGVMSMKAFDYSSLVDFPKITRTEALSTGISREGMHAMLAVGYKMNAKGNVEWILMQNSWGSDSGMNGFYHMSVKDYANLFLIDATIPFEFLPEELREKLSQ